MNAQGGNVIKRDQKANRKFAQSVPPSPSSRLPSSAGGIPPSLCSDLAFPLPRLLALGLSRFRSLGLSFLRSLVLSPFLGCSRSFAKKLDFACSLC